MVDFHDDPQVNQYPDALNRFPLGNREGGAVIHRGTEPLFFSVAAPTPQNAKFQDPQIRPNCTYRNANRRGL